MSRTYEIVCHDCKVRLWVGQGWPPKVYMYKTDKALELLESFLFSHQRHKLEFGDDEQLDCHEYRDLNPDESASPG
jgi:hypothetical protein